MWVDSRQSDNGYHTSHRSGGQTWFRPRGHIPPQAAPPTSNTFGARRARRTVPHLAVRRDGQLRAADPLPRQATLAGPLYGLAQAMSSSRRMATTTALHTRPLCRQTAGLTPLLQYWVFVTDGVNSVTVGRRSASETCLTVLTFDWSASTYTSSMMTASSTVTSGMNNPPNWHGTEQDSMGGDVLWTVRASHLQRWPLEARHEHAAAILATLE